MGSSEKDKAPQKRDPAYDPQAFPGLKEAMDTFMALLPITVTAFRAIPFTGFHTGAYGPWWSNSSAKGAAKPLTLAEQMIATLNGASRHFWDEPLQRDWDKPAMRAARSSLRVTLEAYCKRVREHEAAELVKLGASAALLHGIAADQANPWDRITTAFFDCPADEAIKAELARLFLRGDVAGGLWQNVHAGFPRAHHVAAIEKAMGRVPVVILTGPAGEGKSAVVAQVVHRAVEAHRPVYWLHDPAVLNDPAFLQEVDWTGQAPLIVLDDQLPDGSLPAQFQWPPGHKAGNVLIASHTRHLRLLEDSCGVVQHTHVGLQGLSQPDVVALVACLHQWNAVPEGQSPERTRELIVQSLAQSQTLWPAQFAATRGELLHSRIDSLLGRIGHEPDGTAKVRALSVVAFADRQLSEAFGYRNVPRKSLVLAMIDQLDLDEDFAQAVKGLAAQVPTFLDGELWRHDLQEKRDPVLRFRHPAVTASIAARLFGISRRNDQFNLWEHLQPLCAALPDEPVDDKVADVYRLAKRAVNQWSKRTLARPGSTPLTMAAERPTEDQNIYALVKSCVDSLPLYHDMVMKGRLHLQLARAIMLDPHLAQDPRLVDQAAIHLQNSLAWLTSSSGQLRPDVDLDIAEALLRSDQAVLEHDDATEFRDWRFFARRAEESSAQRPLQAREGAEQMLHLLLAYPDRAQDGEIVAYAGKAGLMEGRNWDAFRDLLLVSECMVEGEGGARRIREAYLADSDGPGAPSFAGIVFHLLGILAARKDEVIAQFDLVAATEKHPELVALVDGLQRQAALLARHPAPFAEEFTAFFAGPAWGADRAWVIDACRFYGEEAARRTPPSPPDDPAGADPG